MAANEDFFYNRACKRIGLERVHEGHERDDDNDSWHLVSIRNNNSSVNGGNGKATDSGQNLNIDAEALNKSV